MLEPVGPQLEATSWRTSQCSVSRRFVAATAERLTGVRSQPLDCERWLIVFVDGFDFAGHTVMGQGRDGPLPSRTGSHLRGDPGLRVGRVSIDAALDWNSPFRATQAPVIARIMTEGSNTNPERWATSCRQSLA